MSSRGMMRTGITAILKPVYTRIAALPTNVSSLYTDAPALPLKIPNIVYQTWKEPVLPLRHARAVRHFRKMNGDYSFRFFNDERMAGYMADHFSGHPILRVFNDLLIPASRADIWRYCILFREGGIYCDIDSVLRVPFREILADDPPELISFEGNRWADLLRLETHADPSVFMLRPSESVRSRLEYPEHVVLNWVLCFQKGSPVLGEAIDLIVRHAAFFRRKKFEPLWPAVIHFTGPLALTQAVWRWMERSGARPCQYGIDFRGRGVFKVPGEELRYRASRHYTEIPYSTLL